MYAHFSQGFFCVKCWKFLPGIYCKDFEVALFRAGFILAFCEGGRGEGSCQDQQAAYLVKVGFFQMTCAAN